LISTALFNTRVVTNRTGITNGRGVNANIFFIQDYLGATGTVSYGKGKQLRIVFAQDGNNLEPRIKGLPIVKLPWLDWGSNAVLAGLNPLPTPFYDGKYKSETSRNLGSNLPITTASAEDQPFLILPDANNGVPLRISVNYSFITYVVYKYSDGSILTLSKIPWTVQYTKVGGGGGTPSQKGTLTSENPQTILATVPNPPGSQAVAINNAIANYQYQYRLYWI